MGTDCISGCLLVLAHTKCQLTSYILNADSYRKPTGDSGQSGIPGSMKGSWKGLVQIMP